MKHQFQKISFALEITKTWSKTNDDTILWQFYKHDNPNIKSFFILNINSWKSISKNFIYSQTITESWSKINNDVTTTRQQFYKRGILTSIPTIGTSISKNYTGSKSQKHELAKRNDKNGVSCFEIKNNKVPKD